MAAPVQVQAVRMPSSLRNAERGQQPGAVDVGVSPPGSAWATPSSRPRPSRERIGSGRRQEAAFRVTSWRQVSTSSNGQSVWSARRFRWYLRCAPSRIRTCAHGSGGRASGLANLYLLPAWTRSLVVGMAGFIPRIFRIMEIGPFQPAAAVRSCVPQFAGMTRAWSDRLLYVWP